MMKVIQFTDTHLFDNQKDTLKETNTHESLQRCIQHAESQHSTADLILVTGDLTHDGKEPAYHSFNKLFSPLKPKVLVLPGNHDNIDSMQAWLNPEMLADFYQHQSWQFIMLDSLVKGKVGGHLSDQELNKLDTLLRRHKTRHTMVGIHHHVVPINSLWLDKIMLSNADALFKILDQHPHCRAITWGHIHQSFYDTHKTIKLFGSPSTCVQFKPLESSFGIDNKTPAYRWFELSDNGVISTDIVYL